MTETPPEIHPGTDDPNSQLGRYLFQQQRRRKATRRAIIRLSGIVFLALACMLVHATVIGLPAHITDPLLDRLNSGNLYVEVDRFKLDLTQGIVASNPRMFRKKKIGPPFIEAEELTIETDLQAWLRGGNPIKGLRITRGTFRKDEGDPQDEPRTYSDTPYGGRFTLDRCEVEGLWVKRLTCRYHRDGPTLEIHDIIGTIGRDEDAGSLKGNLVRHDDQRVMKGHLEGTFNPSILDAILTAREMTGTRNVIQRFDFDKSNPALAFDFTLDNGASQYLRLSGQIDAENCRYNDVFLNSLETSLSIYLSRRLSSITVHPLLITRREGVIEGGFTRDFMQSNTTFNIVSTCSPAATLGLINPDLTSVLEDLRPLGDVSAHAHGIIYSTTPELNDYQVNINADNLGYRQYLTDDCRFLIHGEGLTTTLKNIRGTLYGGSLTGNVEFVRTATSEPTRFITDLKLENLNMKQIGPVITGRRSASYSGDLDLDVRYTGLSGTNNTSTITGAGSVHLANTPAFQLPVIGDLSDILARTIPGLDFLNSEADIKGRFTIEDDRIKSDKIIVEGNVLSLEAKGSYSFDREYDMKVRAKLLKPHTFVGKSLNLIFLPVSQILEFRLDGTPEDPRWTSVLLPRELIGQSKKDKQDN